MDKLVSEVGRNYNSGLVPKGDSTSKTKLSPKYVVKFSILKGQIGNCFKGLNGKSNKYWGQN